MSDVTGAGRGEGEAIARSPMNVLVRTDELLAHCTAILRAAGLGASTANLVADSLVDAEARGIGSHGVTRTRIYCERIRGGMLDPDARPVVVAEGPGSVHLDARNAIGHVGAQAGLDAAVERALIGAVCVAGVAGSNHCGTLAYFTRQAAERGLVGIAMSTAPPTMVYFGGRTRAVGTNPLCISVPRGGGPPITLDMASSATARGKIILAHQTGAAIPAGWAVDLDGRPTTDAAAALAGSVLPFAGHKGSGLAMMVDLVCGALVAGVAGPDIGDMYEDWTRPQRVSHLFVVLDPDGWQGRKAFLSYVSEFARRVRALPPAEGVDRVLLPGEPEEEARARAEREGVPVAEAVAADLDRLAEELGLVRRLARGAGASSQAPQLPSHTG
jgi:LDH2 family malate/lactate/ureidoglycolate dehydrogenase